MPSIVPPMDGINPATTADFNFNGLQNDSEFAGFVSRFVQLGPWSFLFARALRARPTPEQSDYRKP